MVKTDRIAGAVLLALALAWIGGTLAAIPGGSGEGQIGPRGFPLGMGVLLALLSAALLAGSFRRAPDVAIGEEDLRRPEERRADARAEVWALLATFGFLGLYFLLLDLVGFVLATLAAVAAFMLGPLHKRSPLLVAGTAFGLSFGIWLILGKAMGVYLPRGALVDWF